jgi:PII-like signaling protein
MKIEVDAKQVMVFVNSTDQWHGRALYTAIVQLCQEKGIAGASVTRCVEGYGAGHHLHTTRLLELSENLPVRIDIGVGLVTVSDVHILRFLPDPKP